MGTSTTSSTAAPERVRWPRLVATPQAPLRRLLPRGYVGFTDATAPRHLVVPATTSVPLVVRLVDRPRPSPEVGWAWERLLATRGAVPVGRIADEVGWSHKHLIARFRQQVGLRPKTAARLVRFDGVWRRLDGRRPLDWGLVAREAGYADQAHLVRDFHQFTGTTPTRFLAQGRAWQVNSVQDTAAAAS